MSVHSIKQLETPANFTTRMNSIILEAQEFVESGGVKKRRIYYNVDFTEEQQKWINNVRRELKQQKGIQIYQDQAILRFCYAANFDMEKCLQKLDEYHKWFSNPSIQSLTPATFQLFRQGLVYSYGKARDGRPFIILNASVLDCNRYSLENFYQAINHSLNKAIKQFIPGYLEHYYFIIDLNQQLLSLPLTQLAEVIKKIGNAYSGLLHKLMVVNCTVVSKWMYNRLIGFGVISEETANKITLHTKEDLQNGDLRKFISENVLEEKYGGLRPNIDHHHECVYRSDQKVRRQVFTVVQQQQTQYFSIEQNEQIGYYKQGTCCGDGDQCIIY